MEVTDDQALLTLLLKDEAHASALYRPTAYWRPYATRITTELQKNGLHRFRRNQTILKGFAAGGIPRPTMPRALWKQLLWRGLESLPGVQAILTEYKRLLRTTSAQLRQTEVALARYHLADVAQRYPQMQIPDGIANGDADDAFTYNGSWVTAHWVMYLTRAADFYRHVPPEQVTSILEIGPGLGLSSLAHLALNPYLRKIVNIDIVPVAYVSTCFLRSSTSMKVISYSDVQGQQTIPLTTTDDTRPTLWSLPAWSLPQLRGSVDYAFNAFSFQEMEHATCENYAREILRLTQRGIQLHSRTGGHKVKAGGQERPIAMSDLQDMLKSGFPRSLVVGDLWSKASQRPADEAQLLLPA